MHRGFVHAGRFVPPGCQNGLMQQRFLSLADVAEILSISMSQVRALVRSGELKGIQIGGKGTWRIEDAQLQDYIDRMYARTQERLREEGRVD